MSRLTIDTGTEGNPATGDSLRGAFTKVNTNFQEIYNELGSDGSLSDLNFTDNIISTDNTNQNLILSPNGTGQVQIRSASCSGGFGFSGNILSTTDTNADMELDPSGTGNLILKSGNFLPATDNSQYLGSASKRWHTLYVGPGSINIDGVILSASGGKLNMGADIEVNAISSADSSAIQINDGVNISGATHLHGALTVTGDLITLGRETAAGAGSSGMSGTRILGSLELTNPNGSSTMAMGMSFAGASGGEGQMIFEGNNASGYALVPSNNNQYTLGRPEVAGPGSAAYWKNLYVYNVNFPDSTEQTTAARITVVGDDSTGTTFNAGETIKIAGGTGITTAMSGDILTITNTGGGGGAITFVGDDSTGTTLNTGETLKIAGAGGVTTAVSGDTLTITGTGGGGGLGNLQVNDTTLSPITTNSNIKLEPNGTGEIELISQKIKLGDNPIGATVNLTTASAHQLTISINNNANSSAIEIIPSDGIFLNPYGSEKIKIDNNYWPNTDGTNGQTLITDGAGNLSWSSLSGAQGITFVGDDSTGTRVSDGESFKIAGAGSVTTAVSGDTLTITGPNLSAYIESSFTIVTGDGSTTFAAVANQRYGVNTSAGSITVNLPSAPATGDAIFFADAGGAFSTNNLTIGRNGNTIMGLSENMIISTNNSSTGLFYTGSTWRIYS